MVVPLEFPAEAPASAPTHPQPPRPRIWDLRAWIPKCSEMHRDGSSRDHTAGGSFPVLIARMGGGCPHGSGVSNLGIHKEERRQPRTRPLVLLILLGHTCCLFHVGYMTAMVSSMLPASYSSWPEIIVGLEMNFFSSISHQKKAVKIFPCPTSGPLRPIVQCQTHKH
ncbi:hypothetical protein TRIUR3_34429 [Triticum urartu]|uniref:Uncharacterized protein n=1 Tax=Triticum urartu TaxID=4572 RepID=M7Z4W1_TRIUA|nr:hypothetical protein TRIUR3_34429 [Triticum urartu]